MKPSSTRTQVVLGVTGGISAYKAVSLLRLLTESGHDVRVVPTAGALRMVGEPTWAALSGKPVSSEVWHDAAEVPHVAIGKAAELVIVAPATADLLSRAATGRADDLLTATLLTATCPVLMAPAMHTEMWLHPATQANVRTLRDRGVIVLDPEQGRLTGADTGPGRLPEPQQIYDAAISLLSRDAADLSGLRVVVSAGGTREPIDPVRFLGNRSSGKQGYALARAAVARGALVTVVSAHVDLPDVAGATMAKVGTALEMQEAVEKHGAHADVVVMAAAVADFRPAARADRKIKKKADSDEAPTIELVRNPDILAALCAGRDPGSDQTIVGFAAETDDVLEHGRAKLRSKGCDLMVVNRVGDGVVFGLDETAVVILDSDGSESETGPTTKDQVAHAVWDSVLAHRSRSGGRR